MWALVKCCNVTFTVHPHTFAIVCGVTGSGHVAVNSNSKIENKERLCL